MRKRTRWQTSEVMFAIRVALDFERCLQNEAYYRRYYTLPNEEADKWFAQAKKEIRSLRDIGFPDDLLQSLIGFNHTLEEFDL